MHVNITYKLNKVENICQIKWKSRNSNLQAKVRYK